MDTDASLPAVENERLFKTLRECPECRQKSVEKVTTPIGILCCLGCWWLCCLGCCCLRYCRIDFCENCYIEAFREKAKQSRIAKLNVEDQSLYSHPSFDEAIKEEQPNLLFCPKKNI